MLPHLGLLLALFPASLLTHSFTYPLPRLCARPPRRQACPVIPAGVVTAPPTIGPVAADSLMEAPASVMATAITAPALLPLPARLLLGPVRLRALPAGALDIKVNR